MEKEKTGYIAGRIYLSNSCADAVTCAVNGASWLRAWEEMLSQTNFALDLRTIADYDMILAKLVIGSNSSKLPKEMEKRLIEEAQKYPLDNKKFLYGPKKEEAIDNDAKLKCGNTIEGTIKNLNHLLYLERDGLARRIGLPTNLKDFYSKEFEKQFAEEVEQEKLLHAKYSKELTEDCYKFLQGFDPRLAIKLKASDKITDLTHPAL